MTTMMIRVFVITVFFTLSMANATKQVLKGSVNCLDCHDHDLSGIQVLVKCAKVKKLAMTYTLKDGRFETELPSDYVAKKLRDSMKCVAKIMGGPYKIHVPRRGCGVEIVKGEGKGQFKTSKPLEFHKACPLKGKCVAKDLWFSSFEIIDHIVAEQDYYMPLAPLTAIP